MSRAPSPYRLLCAASMAAALGGGAAPAWSAVQGLETAAQEAFEEGIRLMDAQRYDEACPLLEESLRYDPGMATKFRLAECYQRQGRVATAWETYLQVSEDARAASMDQRAEFARERAAALEAELPSLRVSVSDEASAHHGLEIHCDGELLLRAFWDKPIPIDPGPHQVTVSAPGRRTWARRIDVPPGAETATIHFEDFPEPLRQDTDEESATPGQAIAGVVIASTGLLALGAGLGVGIASRGRYDDASGHCVEQYCDPEGMVVREAAMDQATAGSVLFAVGSALLVAGGVLWLTAPDGEASDEPGGSTEIGVGSGGLMIRSTW